MKPNCQTKLNVSWCLASSSTSPFPFLSSEIILPFGRLPGIRSTDEYSYQAAGGVIGKRFRIDRTLSYTKNGYQQNVVRTNDVDAFWTYDNEGKTATMQYPVVNGSGGGTYTSTYDTMSRVVSNGFASGAQYNAADQLTALGDQKFQYHALNQLTLIVSSEFAQQYVYSATQNNGRIIQQLGGPSGWSVNYQYDALNRLSSAVAQDNSWGQSFTYDGFGNLTQQTVTAGSAPSMSLNIDPATNHVAGGNYDANGNQYNTPGGSSLNYDAENRVTYASASGGTDYYFYNGSNQRIWKKTPAGGEEFTFYGLQGERLATFNPQFTTINGVPYMSLTLAETDGYFGSKLVFRNMVNGGAG